MLHLLLITKINQLIEKSHQLRLKFSRCWLYNNVMARENDIADTMNLR